MLSVPVYIEATSDITFASGFVPPPISASLDAYRLAGQRRQPPGPLRRTNDRDQTGVLHRVQPIQQGGVRRSGIGRLPLRDALPIFKIEP